MNKETFPPLTVEFHPDGLVNLIDPTEDGSGNVWAVLAHPAQIRAIAEKLGMAPEVSASHADSLRTAGELRRDNDRMRRNLLQVREHALELQKFMATISDWQHADLTSEMERVNNLVALLDMACGDFIEDGGHSVPTAQSQRTNAVVTVTTPATPKHPAEASTQLELPA